jgi:hypothetical protein
VGPTDPNIDPATAFPAVPADGFIPLTAQLAGTHIRPTKQVLPTVDAWNATVQRQVTSTISVEASYVAARAHTVLQATVRITTLIQFSMNLFGVIDPLTNQPYAQNLRRPLCRPDLSTDHLPRYWI